MMVRLKIKILLVVSLLLICNYTNAQIIKGSKGDDSQGNEVIGKTRALIIGISKYQYIESLKFADNDANEFASLLTNNPFWNIAPGDITLLKNENAKCGDIIAELSRLMQISKAGDKVIFYFSGHGDIETITQFKNGYLLANDTYKNNYITGAIPVSFLKEAFVTLLNKDVKVFMFTDACRSGNLAGGLKGTEFAASAISSTWKNEIKILSSQPGQLSYEDEKWGKGRGVFSYYLTKGLTGEADQNKDSVITISELERYVGENVTTATSNKQQPIFEGPNKFTTAISKVYAGVKNGKSGGNAFKFLLKNFKTEDSCLVLYDHFNKAIQHNIFNGGNTSAIGLYTQLRKCKIGDELLYKANSKLMAALLQQIQEIINTSLKDINGNQTMYQKGIELTNQFLSTNDIKTPYEKHIQNVRTYFTAMNEVSQVNASDKRSLNLLDKKLDQALTIEPEAAYLYNAKGHINIKLNNIKTAAFAFQQAIKYSPTWQAPKDNLDKYNSTTKPKANNQANARKFIPGIYAGINYSNLQFEKGTQPDSKTGFNAGATLQIKIVQKAALQTGVVFSHNGAKLDNPATGSDNIYQLDYIDFTMGLKYLFGDHFSITIAPQVSYLSSAKLKSNQGSSDIKKEYTSTYASFNAGISYEIKNGLGVEAKWITGLQNISAKRLSPVKLSTGQLGIFYRFIK